MSGIKGKVVAVTGASSGIGEATALLLAGRGAKLVLVTLTEGLRQEAGDKLRVTGISPGFIHTDFAESMTNPDAKAQTLSARDKMAISPEAIARAIAFAIEQPPEVDVGDITVRPTAQG
jgi:NADP-dependent 3-hydroxy acid dehydrogenase YdfG